jgi:hypothetical protein
MGEKTKNCERLGGVSYGLQLQIRHRQRPRLARSCRGPKDSSLKTNDEHGIDLGDQLLQQDKNMKQKNQTKMNQGMTTKNQKKFSIKLWRSPLSFSHLIGIKNLVHG